MAHAGTSSRLCERFPVLDWDQRCQRLNSIVHCWGLGDRDDRRAGVATILPLDGVLDRTCASSQCSAQDVERNIDVDSMSASLDAITAKRRSRH